MSARATEPPSGSEAESGGRLSAGERREFARCIADHAATYPEGIPAPVRSELCRDFGVSAPTFYRVQRSCLGAPTPRSDRARRGPWKHTPEMEPYFARTANSTLLAVHTALAATFPGVPKYEAFTKYCKKGADADRIAKLRGGWGQDSGSDRYEAKTLSDAEHPGFRWAIDVKDLHTPVTPDHVWRPQAARVINIIDDNSRCHLVAMPVLGPVGAGHVAAALAQAAFISGGMAMAVRCDNGMENLAESVQALAMRMGSRLDRITSHRKNQNGKVERLHLDLEIAAQTLPQNTRGVKGYDDETLADPTTTYLTLSGLSQALERRRTEHNSRIHSSTGQAPEALYFSQALLVNAVEDELLARYAIKDRAPKKLEPTGAMLFKVRYFDVALAGRIGRKVRLRYLPTVRDVVFVFDDRDNFITRAVPSKSLSAQQRRALAKHNATTDAEIKQIQAQGAQLALARVSQEHAAGAPAADPAAKSGLAPALALPPPGWTPPKKAPRPTSAGGTTASSTASTPPSAATVPQSLPLGTGLVSAATTEELLAELEGEGGGA